ncbi:MAG: PglD-related sugar-binding protein, partial [Promethearchaeota archaeon]
MKEKNKNILVYGARDFGKIVKNLINQCGYNFVGFISDLDTGPEIVGDFKHIINKFLPNSYEIVIALGYSDLKNRWSVYQKVIAHGYKVPSIIHPNSYVCPTSIIKSGSIIMAGSILDFNSYINELVVIWPGAIVGHDSYIGKNTFLSANCNICGFGKIGQHCFIGVSAT